MVVGNKSGKIYTAGNNKFFIYNSYEDLINNKAAQAFTLPSKAVSIDVSADENYIAAGTYDGSIWIKENNTTATPSIHALQKSRVNSVKFNKLNSGIWQVAAASADHTIKLLDVQQALLQKPTEDIITLMEEGHTKWVYDLWYSNDGKHLYSCGEDKKIIGWKKTMEDLYKAIK
ncbi:MAG: hypothetical protein H3C56_08460 [Chitinophagaceae bacterium]|nr:hypothetical protein [Chitinophagaceae bacterium]